MNSFFDWLDGLPEVVAWLAVFGLGLAVFGRALVRLLRGATSREPGDCEKCGGAGYLLRVNTHAPNYVHVTCPACGGKGALP